MQLVGFSNFITELGHYQGIEYTNLILGLIGLEYQKWIEIPWIFVEAILIWRFLVWKKLISFPHYIEDRR